MIKSEIEAEVSEFLTTCSDSVEFDELVIFAQHIADKSIAAELANSRTEPKAWIQANETGGLSLRWTKPPEDQIESALYAEPPQHQDPVGEVIESGGTLATMSTSSYGGDNIPVGTKLYANSQIPQEQSDRGIRVTASKYPDCEFEIHAQTHAVHQKNATLILDEGVEL